ncbi:hypothetical protein VNO80_04772 [Phaseolus coccineus]|uniref:Uncharacterized protein n=1 Tax=Phaseolus coccineus TaxID=3886 RepID=A0AAN9NVH4_PHACN
MEQEMEKRKGRESEEKEEQKWVRDACVDYKGRVPLRAVTGVRKASFFVLAIAIIERITYFGIWGNLIMYLTRVIHQDLKTATNNVNYWKGATTLMPLIGGFVGDAYTGRFRMVLLSSLVYLKDFVSWGVACLALTIFMALTVIAFYMGMPFYSPRVTEFPRKASKSYKQTQVESGEGYFIHYKVFYCGCDLGHWLHPWLLDALENLTSPCLKEHPWKDSPCKGFVGMCIAHGNSRGGYCTVVLPPLIRSQCTCDAEDENHDRGKVMRYKIAALASILIASAIGEHHGEILPSLGLWKCALPMGTLVVVDTELVFVLPSLVRAECIGDAEDEYHDRGKAMRYKIAALASILITSAIGVCILLLGKLICTMLSLEKDILFIIKSFYCGCDSGHWLHPWLHDALENLTSPCLKEHPWGDSPFIGFVEMCIAHGNSCGGYCIVVLPSLIRSECTGDAEDEDHDRGKAMRYKIATLASILIASTIGAIGEHPRGDSPFTGFVGMCIAYGNSRGGYSTEDEDHDRGKVEVQNSYFGIHSDCECNWGVYSYFGQSDTYYIEFGEGYFIHYKVFYCGCDFGHWLHPWLPDALENLTSPCLKEHPWEDSPFTGFVGMCIAHWNSRGGYCTGLYRMSQSPT